MQETLLHFKIYFLMCVFNFNQLFSCFTPLSKRKESPLLVLTCTYACVYVCVWVCVHCVCIHACVCISMLGICTYVCVQECIGQSGTLGMPCFIIFCFSPLRQVLLLKLELVWGPAPHSLRFLFLTVLGLQAVQPNLALP